MIAPPDLLEAARELAELMGKTAVRYFGKNIPVETKADQSPVTEADRQSERVAREWIERRFPHDGVLGEEFGVERSGARRRWIIDPIDGTKTFVRGVPLWGSLVAVEEAGIILAGAASFPAVNEIIAAAPGRGCWANGVRCSVSAQADLARATVLTTDDRFSAHPGRDHLWGALANRAAIARTWGDCFGYLLVATGRAEVMIDDVVSPWDIAAMVPIIAEAGGILTDWRGAMLPGGTSAIATNANLGPEVRTLLGVGPSESEATITI